MRYIYSIGLCLLALMAQSFQLPPVTVARVRMELANYNAQRPEEKIELISNKQDYSNGETVSFAGYVTRQSKTVSNNTVVYIELFTEKGLVVRRAMRPARNGQVFGDFDLPSQIAPGNYFLRAYTAWMLNFGAASFSYKMITIHEQRSQVKENIKIKLYPFSVGFFPEGGQLVSRLTSRVVVRTIDSMGLPVQISGKIVSSLGDTVAVFKTNDRGLGNFTLHCSPQATYTAIAEANGQRRLFPLPIVQPAGIVLHTETQHDGLSDSIFFHLSRTGLQKERYENLLLYARMDGHFSVARIHFDESTFNDPLDTLLTAPYPLLLSNFPTGILELVVLTEDGEKLAERLLYLPDRTALPITIHSVQYYGSQCDVQLGLPVQYSGSISISVIDVDSTETAMQSNYQCLAIIPGAGVSPEVKLLSKFDVNNDSDWLRQLDFQLVATKSSGRAIKDILKATLPPIRYAVENDISLTGRAFEVSKDKKAVVMDGSLFMLLKSLKDSLSKPLNAFTDSAGNFSVTGFDFHDTATVYLQSGVKTQGHTSGQISFEFRQSILDSLTRTYFVNVPDNVKADSFVNDTAKNGSDALAKAQTLQNVIVTAKSKSHLDSIVATYATGIFANPGAWVFTIDLTTDAITKNQDVNVLEYLNGKVAGLMYAYDKGQPIIYWRFSNIIDGLSAMDQLKLNAPSFLLNEALLNTGNQGYDAMVHVLSGIRIADVALIRVFKPGTMPNIPDNGPHGTVVIYLKNGREETNASSKVLFQQSQILGYSNAHSFKAQPSRLATSTLYWNPMAVADSVDHSIKLKFQNSKKRLVRIVAQGVDSNGMVVNVNQILPIEDSNK